MKIISLIPFIIPTLSFAAMEPVALPDGSAERLGLSIEPIRIAAVSDPVRATGRLTLDPLATSVVASPVAGRIEEDLLRRGAIVKAGDRLLTLRSAERAAAVTSYIDSEQRYRFAQQAYARESKLEKRKLTTTEALRERELELARTRTAHLAAIQQIYLLGMSEQRLHAMIGDDLIREDLSEHVMKAPIDGVIIDKMTTPGAPVERNAELLKIAALDHLLVEFQVPLRGIARVREGEPVNFRAIVGDAGSGTATVTGLVPAADNATLAATATARLENPEGHWISGTPVEILLTDPDAPKLPSVPVGSVVEIDGSPYVFIAEGDSVFHPQPVEVVAESGELLGVQGITGEDTRVVTHGAALLLSAWEEAQSAN